MFMKLIKPSYLSSKLGSPGDSVVKNPPANTGDAGSIPELGIYPGGEHGNPLQYLGLENPKYRGAWQATVHRVSQSQTQLKRLSMIACNIF